MRSLTTNQKECREINFIFFLISHKQAEQTKMRCATFIWCITLSMENHWNENFALVPARPAIIGII